MLCLLEWLRRIWACTTQYLRRRLKMNSKPNISDAFSCSLTWFNEEVQYMDVTHTGSSMKWCAALLVLWGLNPLKREYEIQSSRIWVAWPKSFVMITRLHCNCGQIIHTSALTSSCLCNNSWTSSALRLKMACTRGGCKTEIAAQLRRIAQP